MQRGGTVEVVAMLGDSVVDVQHLDRRARGRIGALTWTILAGGLAAIIAAGALFAIALAGAAEDAERLDAWNQLRRPEWAFRTSSPFGAVNDAHAIDAIVLAVFALGIASITIGLVRAAREGRFGGYRVGDHALIARTRDGYAIQPHADLAISHDGIAIDHAAAITDSPFRVRSGLATLVVSYVPDPRIVLPGPTGERRVLGYLAASLAVHLVTWAILDQGEDVMFATPGGRPTMRASVDGADPGTRAEIAAGESEAEHRDGPEGQRGPGTTMALALLTPATHVDASGTGPSLEDELAQAREAGILGNTQIAAQLSQLIGAANLAGAFEGTSSSIDPNNGGEADGEFFGMGYRGFGPGGGCAGESCGTIVSGRYGTGGHGSGTGSGYGFAGGHGGLTGRTTAVPTVIICGPRPGGGSCAQSMGDLDKAIIRRYIRRELPKLQYCYERELIARPDLGGTVKTDFLIAPDGTVTSSRADGIDENVSRCVASVLAGIQFPRSKGGSTQVTYPFTFRTSG